jgi:hypothetical protein|tara:strand:- start:132 stop:641 length:510 start_codon:yes stop_codon:yes gene_type:complete
VLSYQKCLYIDFEGSLKNGIREVGYIISINGIIDTSRQISGENTLEVIRDLQSEGFDYCAAHNYKTEQNLIKKYFPYQQNTQSRALKSGPVTRWLDTVKVYRSLYPQIEKYDLRTLTEIFIEKETLKEISGTVCEKGKNKFHNSLFDSLCVYLLVDRLKFSVNIRSFLQ